MAILDDIEEISVRFVFKSLLIAKVADLEFLINRYPTFAITIVPMAHRAIVSVVFLPLGDRLSSWLNRVDLMNCVGRNRERVRHLSVRESLAFLCYRREYAKRQRHKNDEWLQQSAPFSEMTDGSV